MSKDMQKAADDFFSSVSFAGPVDWRKDAKAAADPDDEVTGEVSSAVPSFIPVEKR